MSDSNDSNKQSSPETKSIASAIIQLLSIPVIADFFQARPWITLVTLLTLFAGNILQVFVQLPKKQTDHVNNQFTEFPITKNDLESICISMESEINKKKEQQIINYKSVELDDDATSLWPVFRWVCVYQAISHDPIAGIESKYTFKKGINLNKDFCKKFPYNPPLKIYFKDFNDPNSLVCTKIANDLSQRTPPSVAPSTE